MKLARRKFLAFLSFAAVVGSLPLGGCSFGSIEAEINIFLPTILTSLTAILSLIPGTAAISVIVGFVKVAVADALQAYADWKAAPPSMKATFLEKLSLAISDLATDFSNLIALIPGSGLAVTLIKLILSTLSGFVPLLPMPSAATVALVRATQSEAHVKFLAAPPPTLASLGVTPARRSKKQYLKEWNADVLAAGRKDLVQN